MGVGAGLYTCMLSSYKSSRSLSHRLMSSCSNRVVNTWNSLPNWVVSANTFKARLDKFWYSQDITYSFTAQLQEPEVVASVYMKNLS